MVVLVLVVAWNWVLYRFHVLRQDLHNEQQRSAYLKLFLDRLIGRRGGTITDEGETMPEEGHARGGRDRP